ncbi:LCP family protein [Sphaerisporangium sp. NPDC005289]|uniref:LCP family protein n=1 Tax=Sphaerisporangium sp. NPDC005289 TaxID=3155247 RepID=UPI0033B862AD
MDELRVLRDFGRDLEHEPPATLAGQRRRLLDVIAAASETSSDRAPTGATHDRASFTTGATSDRASFTTDAASDRASLATGAAADRGSAASETPATVAFGGSGAGAGRGRRGRWAALARPWRGAGWVALAGAAAVTAALVIVPTVLLRGATPAGTTVSAPTWDRPAKPGGGALNVLVVGSDQRPGPKGMPAGSLGERSDVMMLVHVAADRKKVQAISLPRDSMVRIPACRSRSGQDIPARTDMINQAFAAGGLSCAWKTVESTTGVHVDHAVEMRFSGFKDMIDALGGVEVTLPAAVKDPKSKLDLPAGRQLLRGEQALAYVRTRYALGDGSDISRIRRQQALLRPLLDRVLASVDEPDKLLPLFQAARSAFTTDVDMDFDTFLTIMQGVRANGAGSVRIMIVPVRPYPADRNRLEWLQPDAARLFAQLRTD